MKRALIVTALAVLSSHSFAWTQWAGNGHYYEVVAMTGTDFSWSAARVQASALANPGGGTAHLATLTSLAENDFVFSLADNASYWQIDGAGNNEGPYLGGFQPAGAPEPSGGWEWVTGEAWSFTNWHPGEPNNFNGNESRLVFFRQGAGRSNLWNDVGDHSDSIIHWYVAEAPNLVPEPASLAVLGLGGFALARRRRKA